MARDDTTSTVSEMPRSLADGCFLLLQKGQTGCHPSFRTSRPPAASRGLQSSTKHRREDLPSASDPRLAPPKKGGKPADCQVVRWRTDDNLLAGIHWVEVIGRAAQSTWCYFGAHQRKNQKPCLVPPSAWKYFCQILPLWSFFLIYI